MLHNNIYYSTKRTERVLSLQKQKTETSSTVQHTNTLTDLTLQDTTYRSRDDFLQSIISYGSKAQTSSKRCSLGTITNHPNLTFGIVPHFTWGRENPVSTTLCPASHLSDDFATKSSGMKTQLFVINPSPSFTAISNNSRIKQENEFLRDGLEARFIHGWNKTV
ncbi:hypothetical protein TNCT_3661 [Trichonephila clavata]|uniref:Uncharacterized protein n=1 Tax=Trichonephila clavata TaxID=2740835 RepID=A0A8X6KT45_TRICU|nr:hypothetical protein TNCT_3661 [Trichonephila clavata]